MELLLVLVIIATLAALVMPSFIGRTEEADIKSTQGQISHLEEAVRGFQIDYKRYPTTDEGLDALHEPPELPNGDENEKVYMEKRIPKDPWGNSYCYEEPGTHNARFVDIYSTGPDGQAGTSDDIGNWDEESD